MYIKQKQLIIAIFSLLLLLHASFLVQAEDKETDSVYYTALGDSIPNGYCADEESEIVSYPALIAKDMEGASKKRVEFRAYTKNGLTLAKLNERVLAEDAVQQSIQKADVITITIGANDLMNQFKKVCQEILGNDTKFRTTDEALEALQKGITDNPLLLVKVLGAISGWDYASFEGEWIAMMETISTHKKAEAQIVVTTLYNPVSKRELPGTMNSVVEDIIGKMNQIMYDHQEGYNYEVVDLLELKIEEYTQSDGLHPNQEGQHMISLGIEECLDIQKAAGLPTDEEVAAQKARKAERLKLQKIKLDQENKVRQQKLGLVIIGGNALAIWLVIFLYRKKKKLILSTKRK